LKREATHVVADRGVVGGRGEDGVRDTLGLREVGDLAVHDGEDVGVETSDELDVCTVEAGGGRDGTITGDGEGRESLEGESRVSGRATGDEL